MDATKKKDSLFGISTINFIVKALPPVAKKTVRNRGTSLACYTELMGRQSYGQTVAVSGGFVATGTVRTALQSSMQTVAIAGISMELYTVWAGLQCRLRVAHVPGTSLVSFIVKTVRRWKARTEPESGTTVEPFTRNKSSQKRNSTPKKLSSYDTPLHLKSWWLKTKYFPCVRNI